VKLLHGMPFWSLASVCQSPVLYIGNLQIYICSVLVVFLYIELDESGRDTLATCRYIYICSVLVVFLYIELDESGREENGSHSMADLCMCGAPLSFVARHSGLFIREGAVANTPCALVITN